eukprot:Skav227939  [mRNA]  locus=scaffold146:499179:501545:+ [translate_table: standard]
MTSQQSGSPRVAGALSDSEDSGDICGIIEADGLSLEELPVQYQGSSRGSWRVSVLCILQPRQPIIEDEDGDLTIPRQELQERLVGWRIQLVRVASSQLQRVGLQLWAGALVLGDFMLTRPWLFQQRRVCELGAGPSAEPPLCPGLGLCSLLASRLGVASVLCTDGSEEAVENCRENLRRNAPSDGTKSVDVQVEVLKWEDPPPTLTDLWAAEVLLAADVIYDAAAAEAFAKLAARLLKGNAKVLYMSLEKRVYFSSATLKPEVQAYPQFLEDCATLGLHVEQIDLSEIPVYFDYVRSRFYELVMITFSAKPSLKRKCLGEEKPAMQAA